MKIDMIGAGSLGLLLAGSLIEAGHEIRLWCRTSEQSAELYAKGITVSDEKGRARLQIAGERFAASPVEDFSGHYLQQSADLIVITVKQNVFHEQLPQYLLPLQRTAPVVVCFQNGIGHMELLERLLPQADIYAAVTTAGSRRKTLTEVISPANGGIWVGRWLTAELNGGADDSAVQTAGVAISFVHALSAAGFAAFLSKQVVTMIYRKLLINAVINPLTAIWRVPNGELLASEQRLAVMRELYEEALRVYDAAGIDYEADSWESILEVCRTTAGNTSSMLADILAARRTEISWINGSIVGMAERLNMEVPLHRWISRLVEGMFAEER
ncbi:ketopantoate reductase family protein [Paenibacillus donghaensis]|nr:2-dehydropantoate 2-reductase [Paenibacillus donghaensis]